MAKFAFSRTDENCQWDVFDVTAMLGRSLESPFATLSVRIGSDYDRVGMYASKGYEDGKFSSRMKVFFRDDGSGGAPSGCDDAATSSASAATSDDGGGAPPLHDRVSSKNYNYECVAPLWCNHDRYVSTSCY